MCFADMAYHDHSRLTKVAKIVRKLHSSAKNVRSWKVKIVIFWWECWYGKTRMAGMQCGEGRMMIDSVVWAQYAYISVTDTQTATSPQQYSRLNALHSGSSEDSRLSEKKKD